MTLIADLGEFEFLPESFALPKERTQLHQVCTSKEGVQYNRSGPRSLVSLKEHSSYKRENDFLSDLFHPSQAMKAEEGCLWIVKVRIHIWLIWEGNLSFFGIFYEARLDRRVGGKL